MSTHTKLLIANILGMAMSNRVLPDAHLMQSGVPSTSNRKTGASAIKRASKKRRNKK